tara:strand:+ start:63 stop:509 length:447 start_codon:yes stop_codon:yes gene_type:complete
MLNPSIALFVLSIILIAMTAYWALLNHRKYKINLMLSKELDKIIDNTVDTIQKSRKSNGRSPGIYSTMANTSDDLFDQPALMATIITVLVNKFGNVRLSLNDFMISDEEYVSVYVDGATQEIILSLDHNLAPEAVMTPYTKTDDTTFH